MRSDDRGQKKAARLLANLEESRRRARAATYDKQDYDGSQEEEEG
jgi:hypothetical protein